MTFTKKDLGYFIVKSSEKQKGKVKGFVTAEMDEHCLAYILQGLTGRIGKFERQKSKGPLLEIEQKQFDYTKKLRNEIEIARDGTLPE